MKNKEEIQKFLKENGRFQLYLILILMFILFLLSFISSYSNFTENERDSFCDYFNLTFEKCYDFWYSVDNINFTCSECNYSNYTLSTECFNESDCANCSGDLSELEKIDAYAERVQ